MLLHEVSGEVSDRNRDVREEHILPTPGSRANLGRIKQDMSQELLAKAIEQ